MRNLQNRLEQAGVWNEQMERELAALWKYGVAAIADQELRDAIAGFLSTVPVIFFTDHASRSGHMHPRWQLGRHGRIRSIIESCVLLPGLARHIPEILDSARNPNQYAIDIALAATLISDTWVKEDVGDVHHGSAHGRVAADAWRSFTSCSGLPADVVDHVAHGSIWHLGLYAPDWKPGIALSPIARLVNLCDVITAQPALATIYEGKIVVE